MNRVKTTVTIVSAAVLAMTATACGSDTSDYCDQLRDAEETFNQLEPNPTDTEAREEAMSTLRDIADAAPDDLSDDWDTIVETMNTLADIDPANPDMDALQQLNSGEFQSAISNVSEHAEEECDIDMGA